MRRWLFILVAVFLFGYAETAKSQCVGSAGVPFNCQPGGAVGATDLVLGGQSGRTVSFTATQLAAFAAGANQPGIFNTITVTGGGSLSGIFSGTLTFGGNVTFTNQVTFSSGLTLAGVTLNAPTITLPSFLTAGLPAVTASNAGQLAWVRDCLNGSQSAGSGSGCFGIVNQSGSWVLVSSPSSLPVTIGGQTIYPSGATLNQGNGNRIQLATSTNPGVSGQCAQFDSNLNIVPSGGGCNSGTGGSGTVSSGSANQLGVYAANGNTISGLTTANSGVLITSSSGVPSIATTLPASLTIPTATLSNAALTGNATAAVLVGTNTWTTAASTTARSGFNIASGVAPTSPNANDVWATTTSLFARLNGSTLGFLMSSAGGSIAGTSPIAISGSSVTCPTCATTTNGGAITGTSPVVVSAAGAISIGNIDAVAVVQWDSTTTVPASTYQLPPSVPWTSGGTIQSIRYLTGGTNTPSFQFQVQINGTAVTCGGATTFTTSTSPVTQTCTANNTFTSGQAITVVTSSIGGSPNAAYVQVNFAHSIL